MSRKKMTGPTGPTWEIVAVDRVRRFPVPTGWLYQVCVEWKYDTLGHLPIEPIWGETTFVPAETP